MTRDQRRSRNTLLSKEAAKKTKMPGGWLWYQPWRIWCYLAALISFCVVHSIAADRGLAGLPRWGVKGRWFIEALFFIGIIPGHHGDPTWFMVGRVMWWSLLLVVAFYVVRAALRRRRKSPPS